MTLTVRPHMIMKSPQTLLALVLLVASLPLFAQDRQPGDQLQQLTMQLQQSPGDQALREKIIALALTINPKPATPDAATMAEGAAEYAFKNAKVNSDFSDAAKQYEKALLLAPWLAADYFNCGVAHEKADENQEAIRSFSLYLLAAPNADDALAVKKRIGGLQYAAQKAVDEANSPEAQLEKFIKSLDSGVWRLEKGTASIDGSNSWYTSFDRSNRGQNPSDFFLEVHGHEISGWSTWNNPAAQIYKINPQMQNVRQDMFKTTFNDRQFNVDQRLFSAGWPYTDYKIKIGPDGQSIAVEGSTNGFQERSVYERIK